MKQIAWKVFNKIYSERIGKVIIIREGVPHVNNLLKTVSLKCQAWKKKSSWKLRFWFGVKFQDFFVQRKELEQLSLTNWGSLRSDFKSKLESTDCSQGQPHIPEHAAGCQTSAEGLGRYLLTLPYNVSFWEGFQTRPLLLWLLSSLLPTLLLD